MMPERDIKCLQCKMDKSNPQQTHTVAKSVNDYTTSRPAGGNKMSGLIRGNIGLLLRDPVSYFHGTRILDKVPAHACTRTHRHSISL